MRRAAPDPEKHFFSRKNRTWLGNAMNVHDNFISYRHDGGEHLAARVYMELKARGLSVFKDREDLKSGKFDPALLQKIEAAENFLVILTPGCLERCQDEEDWLRKEIRHAISCKRNIVPILEDGFQMPPRQALPKDISEFSTYNGLRLSRDYFDESINKLVKEFLKSSERSGRNWKWVVPLVVSALAAVAIGYYDTTRVRPVPNASPDKRSLSEADSSPKNPKPTEPPVRGQEPKGRTTTKPAVQVPADTFLMGSPTSERDRNASDESQHRVSVDSFSIDTTEVTNDDFREFLTKNTKWQKPQVKPDFVDDDYLKNWKNVEYPSGERGNYPVTSVSWYAAQAYCAWKNERLPTEAEWEYAARAGTSTAYWWGNEWDPAHAAGHSKRGPDPVGKEAHGNPWKLFDMLGNVKEWTSTEYKPYPYDAGDGRENAQSDYDRSVRGGSWADDPKYLRSAVREWRAPNSTDRFVGFRCARTK
jgi:formylglycine-generating enzyme required for sulfatase activity